MAMGALPPFPVGWEGMCPRCPLVPTPMQHDDKAVRGHGDSYRHQNYSESAKGLR